jgi:hypothetical protein
MKITLFTLIQKTEETAIQTIDLINKIDSFYNSAWNKLILIGSIALGIIGILVPIIIQWYQKKIYELSEENLKQELSIKMSELKEELKDTIEDQIKENIKEYEDKIEKLTSSANAKVFHIQGNGLLKEGDYNEAMANYIIATEDYFKSDDYSNLQNTLSLICDNCLPKLSKEEVNDIKISHNQDLEGLLNVLDKADKNGTLLTQIRNIRIKMEKLPEKKADKKK